MSLTAFLTSCGLPYGGCRLCDPEQSDEVEMARAQLRKWRKDELGASSDPEIRLKRARKFQLQYQEGGWTWEFWQEVIEQAEIEIRRSESLSTQTRRTR